MKGRKGTGGRRGALFWMALLLCGSALSEGSKTPAASVSSQVFVAFDTETTGFSAKNDRLVEIGAVRFRGDGEILAVTNWLIHPGIEIPFYAQRVHGIGAEMVAGAPAFAEIFPEFDRFCAGSLLLAHNAPFDTGFLRAELDRAGIAPPALPTGDTLRLFRRWFPGAQSHSLEALTAQLGLPGETYHRAVADAFHIVHIFNEGLKTRPALTVEQLERDLGGFRCLDERRP